MKIVIICPDFQSSNIRKLPWKYVYKIAKYLRYRHEVIVITDSDKRDVDGLKIIHVKRLFNPLKGETEELLNVINKINPDKCIMLLGLTSFLRREFKINTPIIGVFTSPLYSIRELIRNIGVRDSFKYRRYTTIHYLNSLIPSFIIRKWDNNFEKIVFLSEDTREKLVKKGLYSDKAIFIPPGIDKEFLTPLKIENVNKIKNIINSESVPVIMYFTSPLTLRGTDTLVKAFTKVHNRMPCKLILLSRVDYKELKNEEKILKRIAKEEGVSDSVKVISKYLSLEEIKEYLSAADIICLPFKIVISDIPVSILEAMALGKPVVSTNVACIPKILNNNGILVNPNDSEDLSYKLIKLLNNKELLKKIKINSRGYMERYPDWDDIGESLIKLIDN